MLFIIVLQVPQLGRDEQGRGPQTRDQQEPTRAGVHTESTCNRVQQSKSNGASIHNRVPASASAGVHNQRPGWSKGGCRQAKGQNEGGKSEVDTTNEHGQYEVGWSTSGQQQ